MTMKFPFQIIDLTHSVSPESPGWDLDCGFTHSNFIDYEDCTSEIKFRVQQIHSPLGIGTHMDAPTIVLQVPPLLLISICTVITCSHKVC